MAHGSDPVDDSAAPPGPAGPAAPPRGGWPRLYALCVAMAVVVMLLLYWFSSRFNVRMPS